MLSVAAFIFVLGILIFIHEFGHFAVAKWVGIRVERFSLGFPPNILARKIGDTTYCIGVIPLGGYVKMAGDNPLEDTSGSPDEFMSKPVAQRAAVIAAGPFMNYVLTIFLLIGIFYFSGIPVTDPDHITVGQVEKESPAEKAGLRAGDVIIAIDGEAMASFDSLRMRINDKLAEPVSVSWVRGNDTITKTIVTKIIADTPDIKTGKPDSIGIIGFNQEIVGYDRLGIGESVVKGFVTANVMVAETVKFFKMLITREASMRLIGGPVYILRESGNQARRGVANLFTFMALLSISLAVLNVLPIPVLDGGHLCFLAIEKIRGSPLSAKARTMAQQVGLLIIVSLVALVTYNDILRLIRGY